MRFFCWLFGHKWTEWVESCYGNSLVRGCERCSKLEYDDDPTEVMAHRVSEQLKLDRLNGLIPSPEMKRYANSTPWTGEIINT